MALTILNTNNAGNIILINTNNSGSLSIIKN
jgi:hypothetical protein